MHCLPEPCFIAHAVFDSKLLYALVPGVVDTICFPSKFERLPTMCWACMHALHVPSAPDATGGDHPWHLHNRRGALCSCTP